MKCSEVHQISLSNDHLKKNERKTLWVVILTAAMMGIEISAGTLTGSMALLADGWHMASHAGALFISLLAYRLSRSERIQDSLSFGAGKAIPLGGYTSAVILAIIAVLMGIESLQRFLDPRTIQFNEAIAVAIVGLIVNIASAFILHDGHGAHAQDHHASDDHHERAHHRHIADLNYGHRPHAGDAPHDDGHDHGRQLPGDARLERGHEYRLSNDGHLNQGHQHPSALHHDHDRQHSGDGHHDHNLRSAYVHVIADALTSVLAIAGLLAGKNLGWNWLDPAIGLVGSAVILKWAYNLCRETGWELLDGHAKSVDLNKVRSVLSTLDARLIDLHVWRIGPQALACEIILESCTLQGADHYRSHLRDEFGLHHIVIEERRSGA